VKTKEIKKTKWGEGRDETGNVRGVGS